MTATEQGAALPVLAVVNQKGGVGKTTTAVNLSAALVRLKRRVLLIDMDPQGNATTASGIDKRALEHSVSELLLGQGGVRELRHATEAGYALLAANAELTTAELELLGRGEAGYLGLRDALASVQDDYDYVLIDCPPNLNALSLSAVLAATGLLVPVQCEYYALEGLSMLMDTLQELRDYRSDLQLFGVVGTMHQRRQRLAAEVLRQLRVHFGELLFDTMIPRNVRLAEAPRYGHSIFGYDAWSHGARAYMRLGREVLRRREGRSPHDFSNWRKLLSS